MLQIADTIRCADAEDCVNNMMKLQQMGIEVDFLYEKDGERGLWLVVEEVEECD